jgi:quercetin dioxygenase-like cupin family protein
MNSKWAWASLAVVLGVAAVYAGTVLATPSAGQTTSTVAHATVSDLDLNAHYMTTAIGGDGQPHPNGLWMAWIKTHGLSDIYVVDNVFAPNGGTSGWHTHLGPSLIFVKAGTVTNYTSDDPSCAPHVYTAGQSFVDPGGDDEHMIRNEDPAVSAETIAVQFLPQGVDRKIDEPAPPGCPT